MKKTLTKEQLEAAAEILEQTDDELIAAATRENIDETIQKIARIKSLSRQDAILSDLAKKLKLGKTPLKKDLAKYLPPADKSEKSKTMIAVFPGLVDLAADDQDVVFLIKDTAGVHAAGSVDLDGIEYVPPAKEHIPFLLPIAENCLNYYGSDDPELFNDLLVYFKRFSYLPEEQWLVIALVTYLSYLQDHPDIHYLAMILLHAVPERGKSRTGKAITYVAYRGVHLVDMRETNIFRFSGNLEATLFFDIMDLWKKTERSGSEDVLLLRYEKGAQVSRVLYPEKGAFADTVHYPIYGSTIMASNEPVHKILGSRCIAYGMPNAPGNYENPTAELGREFKERLVAWRAKMMDVSLLDIQPIEGISGRLWDITQPLFQICKVVAPGRFDDLVTAIRAIADERTQDRKDSFDGLLAQIIYELSPDGAEHFDIRTSAVTAEFNERWKSDKPKSEKWTGRRLKALGLNTDTKERYSKIRLSRKELNTLIDQYGIIIEPVPGNNSQNSQNLQDTENIEENTFEFLDRQKETRRNSKENKPMNTANCKINEFREINTDTGENIFDADSTEVRL